MIVESVEVVVVSAVVVEVVEKVVVISSGTAQLNLHALAALAIAPINIATAATVLKIISTKAHACKLMFTRKLMPLTHNISQILKNHQPYSKNFRI